MYKDFKISSPFFEVGPKAYLYGEEMLKLAKVIDKTAMKYDVDVIVTPQYTDIKLLADNVSGLMRHFFERDRNNVGRVDGDCRGFVRRGRTDGTECNKHQAHQSKYK